MDPFLKTLAGNLYKKYGRDIQDICLVFPNRRAGLFFRKYLSEAADVSLWSPVTFTINEFVVELSDLRLADPVELLFETYQVYSKLVENPESFDDFYHWGEMMIRDFDDLDKYMINAENLFCNIRDLKEIDNIFDYITPEQKETLLKFWGHFNQASPSAQKESFLKLWNLLYPCYSLLNKNLKMRSLAYEGMIYREVAEKIKAKKLPHIPWSKIIFVGFNALNEAEKIIFRYFRNAGTGHFYWDFDSYYIDNPALEAGKFLRKNILEFPSAELPEQFSNHGSREICIYELPSDITQAKFIHKLLDKRDPGEITQFHDTALILGNEDLLIPVLSSLPQQTEQVNITMGYPLSITPVFSFIDRILTMQKKLAKQTGKRSDKFYYRDVLAIMNHQYIRNIQDDKFSEYADEIHSKNKIYLDKLWFRDKGLLEKIFIRTESIDQLVEYLIFLMIEVAKGISSGGTSSEIRLEKEYIFYFLTRLRKLREIFGNYKTEPHIETFSGLLKKIMSTVKIPFEGEPLGGIQIMGILETRLLDFNNLIILSVNEGVLPKAHTAFSYIPNNLRYAFGMPTREDHDAMYAYYFFRVLQRSRKISLLFNSRSESTSTGERSRYLYQLQFDKRFNVSFKSVGFNIAERKPEPISIRKTAEVKKIMEKYTASGNSYLSPSSLSTYLDCRLKFYFSRIAGLQESDEASEEIEAKDIGTLLHETMFRMYNPFCGLEVSASDIEKMQPPDMVKRYVDGAFRKEFYKTNDDSFEVNPEGQNIIIYEVIKKYASRILHTDKGMAPFKIIELENKYLSTIDIQAGSVKITVRIGGKIDRIDLKDNIIRIIDYKTGQAETKIKTIDELFDRNNTTRNKAVFQTLVYASIYDKIYNRPGKISLGLYITRKIFSEDFDPLVKLKDDTLDFLIIREPFLMKLEQLIREIFDDDTDFDQTPDEENCKYCSFAEICHRKNLYLRF
jgi:CRISPR/Cas system-associated exonuclease Cas4 (RecB family)